MDNFEIGQYFYDSNSDAVLDIVLGTIIPFVFV